MLDKTAPKKIVINIDEDHSDVMHEMNSRNGEPVKFVSQPTRDSFRYRGTLEDNVHPVSTIMFDGSVGTEGEEHSTDMHKGMTPG